MTYRPFNVLIQQASTATYATSTSIVNASGSTISALTPVRVNSLGQMQTIDVAVDTSALSIVGLTGADVINGASGSVITQGRLLDVTTSFAVGDYAYVSKTGTLTNVLPTIGVNGFLAGDFVIRVGVIAKNELDGNKKDIFVGISIVGQL